MRKSQSQSMKIFVVIASLVLLILVFLLFFSFERLNNISINSKDCFVKGGVCRLFVDETPNYGCQEGEFPNEDILCDLSQAAKERICCLKWFF